LGWLWTSLDPDYAAAFAQLHEGELWQLTLDVHNDAVLDLTPCGLDAAGVAARLRSIGIDAHAPDNDPRQTHKVLWETPTEQIRAAGYRAVRLREYTNWGEGEHHAESVLIVDVTTIIDSEVKPLPAKNFQVPDHKRTGLGCQQCRKLVAVIDEKRSTATVITFRCTACGHWWSTQEASGVKQ